MGALLQYKKIIFIIILVLAGLVVYNTFFKPDLNTPLVTSDAASATGKLAVENEIITLLGDLHSIELDDTIFHDNAFTSLQDFSLPVEDEPKGRSNPFAPIGLDAALFDLGGPDISGTSSPAQNSSKTTSPKQPRGTEGAFPEDFLEGDPGA